MFSSREANRKNCASPFCKPLMVSGALLLVTCLVIAIYLGANSTKTSVSRSAARPQGMGTRASSAQPLKGNGGAASGLASGLDHFAIRSYGAVGGQDAGNRIYSPYSAAVALGMAHLGARGETRSEICTVLGAAGAECAADGTSLAESFSAIINDSVSGNENILKTANFIYVQKDFPLVADYSSNLEKFFAASSSSVSFEDAATKEKINGDIANATNNKIPSLFDSPFAQDTRVVLANAVHFKGEWLDKFKIGATKKEPFTLENGTKTEVDLMHLKKSFRFFTGSALPVIGVELGYKNSTMAMIVLLPKESNTKLADVESQLISKPEALTEVLSAGKRELVDLSLPKFKIESTMSLVEGLQSLGARKMFTRDADFRGLSAGGNLKVDKVLQKALIEVNEEGTEAAAATGMEFMLTSMPQEDKPVTFRADRPFSFLLVSRSKADYRKATVLFVGKFVQP